MIPKVASFLGTTQTKGNVMFAVSCGCLRHGPAIPDGPVLPAPDCRRPDGRRGQRVMQNELPSLPESTGRLR